MLNPVYLKRQPEQPNSGTDPIIPLWDNRETILK